MKQHKIISIFLMALALASCKDDSLTEPNNLQDSPTRVALSGQMGQEQRLGFGYNAAYTITDEKAFSTKPILNYDKLVELENRYGQIFSEEPRHITTTDILTGNTLQELSYSETRSETKSRGFIGCGKTYSTRKTVITESSLQEDVAKVKIKTVVSSRTVDVGMLKSQNMSLDPKDNNSILALEYRTAVNDLVKKYGANISGISLNDAAVTNFCETFGTHLVVSADLGGVAELQMAIDRSSCIETTHAVEEVQTKIFGIPVGSSNPQKWSAVDSLKNLKYKSELYVYGGSQATIKAMQQKVSPEVQGAIATSEYRDWAASIVCKPGTPENNATFVRGRYVPLYELVPEDQVAARQVLTRVFELYLKTTAPTADPAEPPYGYFDVRQTAANAPYLLPNSDVRIVNYKGNRAALLCMEYVPSIRGDKPCVVAYPLIRGNDEKYRPYLYGGYFVGDESHRPGVVKWQGSASFYVPSDTIYYGKDAKTDALFDPVSKSLKKLYVYWNNVRPMPCPAKEDKTMEQYSSISYSYRSASATHSTTFAKVADNFWSVQPMKCNEEKIDSVWKQPHKWFRDFLDAHKAGIAYYDSGKHYFMLGEGGSMPLTIGDNVTKDFNRKVTKALSKTINAYKQITDEMPTREQAENLGKMLGGRTYILFDRSFPAGRNILGLDWPDGYRAIGGPGVNDPETMQTLDDKAKVILSREWTVKNPDIVPVRIGASGGTTSLDYFEYVSAFNFSSSDFYRYFPIYIVKQDF